ncbi:MAG TPA: dihydrodipicolinate synthase family protein [Acetobacteraceae bacterium]|nr:dihydrodipicolinate synthase family protein [Acetobacteraceae bacterium]
MNKAALYGGVNVAVVTAMRRDLTVDLELMAAHCRWLLAQGVNGLGVLGTTGEANSLGVSERIHLMEGLVERGLPAARMLPGVGVPAISDTVAMGRRAGELGCRGVLVLPPFFYKNPSEDGLFAYYSEVIQRLGGSVKLYFYHFPAQSAVPITISLIERVLRAYPGAVQGIKDSTGDWSNTKSYIDHFAAEGFEVYCGDDSHLLQVLQAGGAGSISACSNVSVAVNAKVYAEWDQPSAAQAQLVLTSMRAAVTASPLIPGLKALVARHTGEAEWENIRPPHVKLTVEQKAKLFAAFDACGVELAKAA